MPNGARNPNHTSYVPAKEGHDVAAFTGERGEGPGRTQWRAGTPGITRVR